MKKIIGITTILTVLLTIVNNVWAGSLHTETTSFKVRGNCEMCEERIESALKKNKAVISADWNVKTKIVLVEYNPHTLSVADLHQIVAEAGHDTDAAKASDATYKKLPRCCHYKR